MQKILLFGDPGIDDSLAIIYGLLHPNIDIVGIVTSYGNVSQEQTEQNAAYLLSLAGREDIPLISGAKYPLSGESVTFYPEIHGPEGLGPIRPPDNIVPNIVNFDEVFTIIERYENELIIVDVGRSSSLAIAFILGGDIMNKVKAFYLMGGAFLVPGNVTAKAEANFHGDPIATNLVVERGRNVTIIPLNVTNEAIATPEVINYISRMSDNPFAPLIEPIFDYYFEAYKKNVPGIQGAPLHDVVTLSAIVNPTMLEYTSRRVTIELFGKTKGESIADFRPTPDLEPFPTLDRIGMQLNYQLFMQDFVNIMTRSNV
ncbi:nucleoside hydrolase [Bacillus luteolus]|uniref:Nucleoside hydrolase n=1 Tax=Litchfieldia luteola TaxID=682179 RepID=A0ABR9QN38_9BACI|nr:nucleoside hydrolase [Cytobacillus luteolus]MBE4909584.1 nucleoside hydrolase [Cytobacillus luteolus]MBP1940985.1 purine nucleosidase [Cytobacillus luteolus]